PLARQRTWDEKPWVRRNAAEMGRPQVGPRDLARPTQSHPLRHFARGFLGTNKPRPRTSPTSLLDRPRDHIARPYFRIFFNNAVALDGVIRPFTWANYEIQHSSLRARSADPRQHRPRRLGRPHRPDRL